MVLVGKLAPNFTGKAVVEGKIVDDFSLMRYRGTNVVLFFYPLDFTFVCPTELHAFQENIEEFTKRNTQIIGCSVDSVFTHLAWLNTPKAKGGIEGISYPLIADLNKTIASSYEVLIPHEGIAWRGLFMIDVDGIVRHQVVNDLPLGRSISDILRILDAWSYFRKHGEVCPANWSHGQASMKPTKEGLEKYFATRT